MDGLSESIRLLRGALTPPHDCDSGNPAIMTNLANSLITRFIHEGNGDDLHESIVMHLGVLSLRARDDPDRFVTLNALATCLGVRCKLDLNEADLEESV